MYNRYIPQETEYYPLFTEETSREKSEKNPFSIKNLLTGGGNFPFQELGKEEGGDPLGGLLKSLKLDGVDSGDILLILIILFLLLEGDDHWELVITLGLLLILGLADGKGEE